MSPRQRFGKTEVENAGWWNELSNQRLGVFLSEPPRPLPLISSPKHTCGVSPTHPNKGTNDFNYGVIAESGVN